MPIERPSVVTKLRPRAGKYKALPDVPQAQAESISQRAQPSKKSIDAKPTSSPIGNGNKSWEVEYQDAAALYIDAVLKLAKLELDDRSPSHHGREVRSMVIDKAIQLNSNRIASPNRSRASQRLVVSAESSAGSSLTVVETDEEPPPSKGAPSIVIRCNGWTKSGIQCKRNVRSSPGLAVEGAATEIFCYQHRSRLLQPTGFYASKGSEWVSFNDWIPSYLHPDTQAALRVEMEKLPSPSDSPGHIYVFEIRDRSSDRLRLKVGRATNVVKRIDEWDRQCRTHEHVIRGWYPEPENKSKSKSPSHLKGLVKVGDPAAWCHRLERLIHLELADLATRSAYLDPDWPVVAPLSTSNQRSSVVQCSDCGESHREIFDFVRVKQGKYRNKEWEMIVLPVIRKWGQFTAKYL